MKEYPKGSYFTGALEHIKFENKENTAKFTEAGAEALDLIFLSKARFNENNKKLAAYPSASQKDHFQYITTPHPIGNLSAKQCLTLDLMSNIDAEPEKAVSILKDSLEYYKELGAGEYKAKIEEILNANPQPETDEIQTALASLILASGIPTAVISRKKQKSDSTVRNKYLLNADHFSIKTWTNNDADGDPENDMAASLPSDVTPQGQTLIQIFDKCTSSANRSKMTTAEMRISCEDKRGVAGVKTQLQTIAGVKFINSFDDLLDEGTYKTAYDQFKAWLETAKYTGKEGGALKDRLDFVLRVASPAFMKAEGLVLSDFDSDAKNIMPGLRFILKATEQFLHENGRECNLSQTIMPLCENRHSIEQAENVFQDFLDKVKEKYDAAKGNPEKLEKIRQMLLPDGKNMFWGVFTGPSDLTKDMGGRAANAINKHITDITAKWAQFKKDVPELALGNAQIKVEFGKGTSNKRGGNMIPSGVKSITWQGSNFATWSRMGALFYAAIALGQNQKKEDGLYELPEGFYEAAIETHQKLLGEKQGSIIARYDELITNPETKSHFDLLKSKYSNNQGTRGGGKDSDQLPGYADTRAIGCASITSYIGLLTSPAFPDDEKLLSQYDLTSALKNNEELDILLKELYQYVAFSANRADKLGFDINFIAENIGYINKVMHKLSQECGLEFSCPYDLDYAPSVKNLVAGLRKIHDNPALELFEQQIGEITAYRDMLDSSVQEAVDNGFTDEKNAEIALINSAMANYQLPVIAYNGIEKGKQQTANDNYVEQQPDGSMSGAIVSYVKKISYGKCTTL